MCQNFLGLVSLVNSIMMTILLCYATATHDVVPPPSSVCTNHLTCCQFLFNRHNTGWDIKIFCYVALLVGLTFAPNPVFDDHGFIWVARIGAFVFLILQQVILIDSAYCVNE